MVVEAIEGVIPTIIVLGTFALMFVRQIGRYPLSRAVTAATGAIVLVAVGIVPPERALDSISVQTLLLLFGMLIHVAALARSGFYQWTAVKLVAITATPRRLTLGALVLSAVLSAVALNDATVLLLTSVLVVAAKKGVQTQFRRSSRLFSGRISEVWRRPSGIHRTRLFSQRVTSRPSNLSAHSHRSQVFR